MTFGTLPNVNSTSLKRDVNSGAECSFPHRMVEEQPNKKPKKVGIKNAVAFLKDVRQLGCVSQDGEPPESAAITRKGTQVLGTNSTSTIHKSCAVSSKHPRKQKSIAEKYKSKFIVSAVPTL